MSDHTVSTAIRSNATPAWLDEDYALDASAIENYRRDGHTTLKQVANSEQIAEQRAAVDAAIRANEKPLPPLAERNTYERAFQKHMNLWVQDPGIRPYVLARRYGRIAAELMGVDGVRIYHDQALFKEPGGGHTPWHQDQHYWPVDTDKTITMWMPLVDLSRDMGILHFASRSNREGYLGDQPISDESEAVFEQYIRERGFSISGDTSLRAGDATFHSGWTLHAAPPNSSPRMREVMTIIWVADGCRVTEPVNFNQRRDLQRWMPGLAPGDLVASPLNPLVYHRDPTQGR